MFYIINVEDRIAEDHPLRVIKKMVESELARMSRRFSEAYSDVGRPSVPPERLLKAMLLQALYSIRSERQLVERINTDLLFRWFLDMDPGQEVFHPTVFTKNRDRLAENGLVAAFFDGVVRRAMQEGLTSDDHFTVDGTLIRSHAALKSVRPIDRDDESELPREGRNPSVDFRGEKRSNSTHRSATDPQARLYRKGDGQPAQLCHSAHALTENRHGLVMAVSVAEANGRAERAESLRMLRHMARRHRVRPLTLGADKGYDDGAYLTELEEYVTEPHVAIREGPITLKDRGSIRRWLAQQQMKSKEYKTSQRRRKLLEEAWGWIKAVAGLARTKLIGRWKLLIQVQVAAAAYNLVRMRNLMRAT
jgi:transposase